MRFVSAHNTNVVNTFTLSAFDEIIRKRPPRNRWFFVVFVWSFPQGVQKKDNKKQKNYCKIIIIYIKWKYKDKQGEIK